jgi:hypothetical protein
MKGDHVRDALEERQQNATTQRVKSERTVRWRTNADVRWQERFLVVARRVLCMSLLEWRIAAAAAAAWARR